MPRVAPTILVADDNEELRSVVAETLRDAGYEVLEAASGEEALRLPHENLALIVADIIMPPEGGIALVDALKARVAGLKVLFISGYGASNGRSAIDPVLGKPFSADELLRRVAELAPEVRSR